MRTTYIMRPLRFTLSILTALFLSFAGVQPVAAVISNYPGIPVRAMLLVDQGFEVASTLSGLYENTRKTLDINKIPFEVIDITEIDKNTFFDSASNLKYSVVLLFAPAWRISENADKEILRAAGEGTGMVCMWPEAVNDKLYPLFGIEEADDKWQTSSGIKVLKDKFTFSYGGETIDGSFSHKSFRLSSSAEVVGTFGETNDPAIWCCQYKQAKTVFHNCSSALTNGYRGVLLQSILYAMPVGASCPVAAGVIEVDDCPYPLYTDQGVEEAYYNYFANLNQFFSDYNFRVSYFLVFSYDGHPDDFYIYPESLEAVNYIIKSGNEIGLHAGSRHVPLKVSDWGSKDAVDTEVKTLMTAMDKLRTKLKEKYGTDLGNVVSYIPPANEIDDYGFESLSRLTGIKYVGTVYYGDENVSARDFGMEGDTGIYNLPRSGGAGFHIFNTPGDKDYSNVWNGLRSTIESGDSYLILTHPYAWEFEDEERFPNSSIAELFNCYRIWADYVAEHYPFYRWWTSAELGKYLESREGVLDARWVPQANQLIVKLSQSQDVLHVKASGYLKNIEQDGDRWALTFGSQPGQVYSDAFEITNVGQDYYLCPRTSRPSHAVIPEKPFIFTQVQYTKPQLASPVIITPAVAVPDAQGGSPVMAVAGIGAGCIFLLIGIFVLRKTGRRID
jgi:hypothetical protein